MFIRLFLAMALMIATTAPSFADQKPITPEPQKKGFILIPLIIGAVIGAAWWNSQGQKCYRQVIMHDENGKAIVKTICETAQGPVVVD